MTSSPADEKSRRQILERLFQEYSGSIVAYFRRQGFSEEQARDLSQETFVRAWKGLDGFRSESSGSTWLFRIARNLLLNTWREGRALKREGLTVSFEVEPPGTLAPTMQRNPQQDPEDDILDSEAKDLLHHELTTLPKQMRQCLELRLGDFKYREIAETLDISIETVKSHLYQARQRLRISLEPYFDIDLDDGRIS